MDHPSKPESSSENNPYDAHNPLIIFDGNCNLCHATVLFLIRRDHQKQFRLMTNTSNAGKRFISQINFPEMWTKSVLLLEHQKVYVKSDAVLRIVRYLPAPWRYFWIFSFIPKFLRDFVYDFVAKIRYGLFGQANCQQFPPEITERLYDQ